MRFILLVLCLLLISSVSAQVQSQNVDILLHDNGIAEQHITLHVTGEYDSITYTAARAPLGIVYDGDYTVDGTTITFDKKNAATLDFTLIFNDATQSQGAQRSFSLGLEPADGASLSVSLTLPEGAVLADADPAATPEPRMTTDGRTLTLAWESQGPLDLIVLYEVENSRLPYIIAFFLLIAVVIAVLFIRRTGEKQALHHTLGDDELLVVRHVKNGVDDQKELCARCEFSKSKMSKVVRKLEEKNVISKRPHFKTNKLSLNDAWK